LKLLAGIAGSGLLIAAVAGSSGDAVAGDARRRDDPLVELGRRLFFDPAIGRAGRVSCAACHDPEHGFSDARVQSVDETGPLPRHSQPITDLAGRGFHWDGEFDTVREIVEARVLPRTEVARAAVSRSSRRADEEQAAGVALDESRVREKARARPAYYGERRGEGPVAAPDESPVEVRLNATGLYKNAFAAAFGESDATAARVVSAVDAYVNSLRTTQSPFDRFLAGRAGALTAPAARGRELFVGKAACSSCHSTESRDGVARLTDGAFHDTGVAWEETTGKANDEGRGAASMSRADDGKFKTPSLRDVARRAPYMHDGRFATLADVVAYYDKGGTPHAGLDPKIKPIGLTKSESADLVAFLESLTGDERAGLAAPTADRPKQLRVRVVDANAKPRAGAVVTLVPAGDRLRGAPAKIKSVTGKTNDDGVAALTWPMTTHVRVETAGLDSALASLVPDWTAAVDVVTIAGDETLLSLPTGFVERYESLRLAPKVGGATATMTVVRRLATGRSIYAVDGLPAGFAGSCVILKPDGGTIGDIDPSKWHADAKELVASVASDGAVRAAR
jgi:cytochrome c peroxidase